jgi:hypothetical protein
MLPKRIILSRKGFDGTAGGCPSPIFPDGTMFSIPIPESEEHTAAVRFEDLGHQGRYSFPKRLVTSARGGISLAGLVHLDPDIRPTLRGASAAKDCRNTFLFGQDDKSQSHLETMGVGRGDLFLFFGLFKRAKHKDDAAYFELGAPRIHVIWGWLEVGERHLLPMNNPVPKELRLSNHHPHLSYRNRPQNCIYVGSQSLSFCDGVPGAGIFGQYSDDLRLTSRNEGRPSYWTLPAFFAGAGMTFHGPGSKFDLALWERQGEFICGQSAGRGQEFVINTEGFSKQTRAWLESVFQHAKKAN